MLFGCTGYYSYEKPYEPKFPGQENFPGPIVHPQKWQSGTQFCCVVRVHDTFITFIVSFEERENQL